MRYLLDTHVIIRGFDSNDSLPQQILSIMKNPENVFLISIVSIWEIVIKLCVKKLNVNFTLDILLKTIKRNNITILPIKQKYLKENLKLKMIHGDPFDRLIIATAISEKLTLITSDRNMHLYDVDTIW